MNIGQIQEGWRQRQRWHRAEKALILQAKAACRAYAEGDKKEGARLFDLAQRKFKIAHGRKRIKPSDEELDPGLSWTLSPFMDAIDNFERMRKSNEKQLEEMVMGLPIASFIQDIRGFGALMLAGIIGEAGDLSNYPDIGRLHKRMGVAVIDGKRQGGLRKGSDKILWIEHGYNPSRRSVVWCLGDCLVKLNRDGKYRTLYLAKKAEYLQRPGIKKIHADRMAKRYMEKRLLKDLWQAWRRARGAMNESSNQALPVAA